MKISTFVFRCFFLGCVRAAGNLAVTYPQDQTSPRANTLYDDPDDIQRQLDNEARDRNKIGKLKTVWVFHLPTPFPRIRVRDTVTRRSRQIRKKLRREIAPEVEVDERALRWEYKEQNKWGKKFPTCDGVSQSPVDLPHCGLPKAKEGRKMVFSNFDTLPSEMSLFNDGKSLTLYGDWPKNERPIIYGGAAHSRCYVFHSMTLHWPSEHAIGGLQFPLETQALYVSSAYGSLEQALNTSLSDPLALLSVATMYKYSGETHKGLLDLLNASANISFGSNNITQQPLAYFQPPFTQYATYHGSLTKPPCSESVLWFIRANSLPVTRELLDTIQDRTPIGQTVQFAFRQIQRMNDRRVFLFI